MMTRGEFDMVFHGADPNLRFAVESPVRYEVWFAYAQTDDLDLRVDLIVHVRGGDRPELVARRIRERFATLFPEVPPEDPEIAVTGDFLAVRLRFDELVRVLLPMTDLGPLLLEAARRSAEDEDFLHEVYGVKEGATPVVRDAPFGEGHRQQQQRDHMLWLVNLVGAVALRSFTVSILDAIREVRGLLVGLELPPPETSPGDEQAVEQVTVNRTAGMAVTRSRATIKADAAVRLFDVTCTDIVWAVLDSGIDATHPAFADRAAAPAPGRWASRVVATYDFTGVRQALARASASGNLLPSGTIDWDPLLPDIEVPHDAGYREPGSAHGTHVAGILGGDWPEQDIRGVCPDIKLVDLRVLDAGGRGDEFSVVAALQFVRWLNERQRALHVAGVNVSLSIPHDVANYSCGWTPVCVECDRLVRAGVVVVAAAGNAGIEGGAGVTYADGTSYRTVSIADPGNTDRVITVGSTHAVDPHRHGVSYFSGKGPTADGRLKPDLLAPGERIDGPIPRGELRRMDGTSQAAPHVSGAAALLLARYRELRGQPDRVKEILCSTATDLHRERSFQGHGLVDVLRAMQAL